MLIQSYLIFSTIFVFGIIEENINITTFDSVVEFYGTHPHITETVSGLK